MLQWCQDIRLERLGVFTYSHEEDTHAFHLTDDVPQDVKQSRAEEIMAVQQQISLEKNQAMVGSVVKTLFDRKEGNFYIGRTEFDSPEVDNEVLVDATANYISIGDMLDVQITSASEFDLFATVLEKK